MTNDQIGDTRLVVFTLEQGPSGRVFDREVDGRVLGFELDGDGIVDRETGSRWTGSGQAVDGPLEGAQLTELPSRTAFWFAFASAFPHAEVVRPER